MKIWALDIALGVTHGPTWFGRNDMGKQMYMAEAMYPLAPAYSAKAACQESASAASASFCCAISIAKSTLALT